MTADAGSLIHILFRQADGREIMVEAGDAGATLLELALNAGVDGIIAECGGQAACATCHVYIGEAHRDLLPAPDRNEDEMLEGTAAPREPGSRLACQIPIHPALSGMAVTVPECQL